MHPSRRNPTSQFTKKYESGYVLKKLTFVHLCSKEEDVGIVSADDIEKKKPLMNYSLGLVEKHVPHAERKTKSSVEESAKQCVGGSREE